MAKVKCCKYVWKDVKKKKTYMMLKCNSDGSACKATITQNGRTWSLDEEGEADECDLCWPVKEAPKKADAGANQPAAPKPQAPKKKVQPPKKRAAG